MVLSPDYLMSTFASTEWAATFAQDPQGIKRKLVPVVVRPCEPEGLIAQIVHIDLVGLDPASARDTLLAGISNKRIKPRTVPAFPGVAAIPPTINGPVPRAAPAKAYIPKIKIAATDIEKRRFLRSVFGTVKDYFENALPELAAAKRGLEFDFQPVTNLEFTAEIFLNGKSLSVCRIWIGNDMLSRDGIAFVEGRHHSSGSVNDVISVNEADGALGLATMMGGFGHSDQPGLDTKHMTPEQGAEYLWRRFTARLEY
jgi:hypothetical protein